MKKILTLILTIGFILGSCADKIQSNSYWLAVKSYPIPTHNGNKIFDGTVLHFEDDSIETGNIYFDKTEKYNLRIKGDKIFLNDTLQFTIFKSYTDSIILDYGFNTRIKFLKLEGKLNPEENFFQSEQWNLIYDKPKYQEFNRKLILTDLSFLFDFDEITSQICIEKDLPKNQFKHYPQRWKSKTINGDHLFAKTKNYFENEFYRVTNYLNDSVAQLECLNCKENISARLKSIKNIDSLSRQKTLKNIYNNQWKIVDIFEIDTISSASRFPDSIPLQLKSLKNRDLSFLFSDNLTFDISESGVTKVTGNWNLSPTGQEIILNSGDNPSDYIDIINITSDSLEIGNLRIFEPEVNSYGMDIEMYYKVTLKK